MIFLVVMYGCESWTTKKAKHWRTDAFKLWCWRRLLRIPWTARRSNQPILKEINPEYSLQGLMLKLQYSGHLRCEEPTHWKRPWGWERLRAGEGGNIGWNGWMASSTQWTWIWASSGRWRRTGKPIMLQSMGLPRVRHNWETEQHIIYPLFHAFFLAQYPRRYEALVLNKFIITFWTLFLFFFFWLKEIWIVIHSLEWDNFLFETFFLKYSFPVYGNRILKTIPCPTH